MKRKILILVSMFMLLMTGCSKVKYKELEKNLEGKIDQIANKIKEKSMENREEVLKNYYETTETKQVPEVIAKYILQDSKETFDNLKININGDIYKFEPYYISQR
ncbi:hypothetical protein [Caloranaerobacter ferrireducens]|uniref:hypothetical protein n=1 Tax=Caloranaerobacter ferrireducens TaxID=1323370 RepID=UPI00084D3369|nr:hypothetical protein [Caloranaerobacter ferrireducens]